MLLAHCRRALTTSSRRRMPTAFPSARPSSPRLPSKIDFLPPQVSVEFGSLAPFSHNKICALSRTRITTALYGSGKSVVGHAADFLVSQDIRGIHGENIDDGGGRMP